MTNPVHWMYGKDLEKPVEVTIPKMLAMEKGVLTERAFTDLTLTYASLKQPKKSAVIHSYCPFCGTKYTPDDADQLQTLPSQVAADPTLDSQAGGASV